MPSGCSHSQQGPHKRKASLGIFSFSSPFPPLFSCIDSSWWLQRLWANYSSWLPPHPFVPGTPFPSLALQENPVWLGHGGGGGFPPALSAEVLSFFLSFFLDPR